jgi:hypothetical protein
LTHSDQHDRVEGAVELSSPDLLVGAG